MLAAITPAAPASPAAPDPLAGLEAIAPPVEVPWPEWVWWAIGGGALVLVALLVWLGYWLASRKKAAIPPTPRAIALREIEALRPQVSTAEPYQFTITVSDVLRRYLNGEYGLQATQQTSPEFLANIASFPNFTSEDRTLLATFLEKCDLLKFARLNADENAALLGAAAAFVQGGRADV